MSRIGRLARGFVCLFGTATICACTEEQAEPVDFENGIWMLSNVVRTQEGTATQCRPMLFDLFISDTAVEISTRAYPCEENNDFPPSLSLRRLGSALYAGDKQVGALHKRRMDIALPTGERTLSWDLDRPDASWQEAGYFGATMASYSAHLDKRPNNKPVPIAVYIHADEDKPVNGWAHAANMAETDIRYMLAATPSNGWIEMFDTNTGRFRLTPDQDFAGKDEFRFFVVADNSSSPPASVIITYTGEPDPPVANETLVSTLEDQAITFFPEGKDPDGDLVKLELVSSPKHGTAVRTGLSVTYKPDPEFSGSDGLDYFIDDGSTKSNVGHIEILVNPVNDPPVAINQEIAVTSGSATPVTLQALDKDSSSLMYGWDNKPQFGELFGEAPHFVYVPNPGVMQGTDQAIYRALDEASSSVPAVINFTISPGTHGSTLLKPVALEGLAPLWSNDSHIYFLAGPPLATHGVGVTNGTQEGTKIVASQDSETLGFDNNIGGVHRTTFFDLGAYVYFTTSTTGWSLRLYRTDGNTTTTLLDLPPPGNGIAGEPVVGNAFINGNIVYLPVHWKTANNEYLCTVTLIDSLILQTDTAHSFPAVHDPCSGLWTHFGAQYMFVGSSLLQFPNMQTPPVTVKNLGIAKPTGWMVEAGGKLFFQTRTDLATGTQIDLWVTDGTTGGTQPIKTLETELFEFDIFSPVAFLDKLYFAHRKSLWSSDGTAAGTNIVATMPVTSVVGDGAIGTIASRQGKLYFLATTDAAGREPWVSDGTPAGTMLLRDVRTGLLGSSLPSKNRTYFHDWLGQTLFVANDGGSGWGLWTTNGTFSGTQSIAQRPMTTILGILGNTLVFHDGHFFYAMDLN